MKTKDNPRYKTLEWFLQFLSDDLDSMTLLDFSKRVLEARYYFANAFVEDLILYGDQSLPVPKSSARSKSHPRVEGHINYSRNKWPTWMWPDKLPSRDDFKLFQSALKNTLEEIRGAAGRTAPFLKNISLVLGKSNDGRFKVFHKMRDRSFEDRDGIPKLMQIARASFAFALAGLPEGAIKNCRECGRFFLHLSKKPKFYCDYRCTSKATSRRRREADPEGYRTAQREIMRKKRGQQSETHGKPTEEFVTKKGRR